MEGGRAERTDCWALDGEPLSVGMMKVTVSRWWWTSFFASSASGMRWPIPGVGSMATWAGGGCGCSIVVGRGGWVSAGRRSLLWNTRKERIRLCFWLRAFLFFCVKYAARPDVLSGLIMVHISSIALRIFCFFIWKLGFFLKKLLHLICVRGFFWGWLLSLLFLMWSLVIMR